MTEPLITPELVRLGVTVTGDKHAVIAEMADVIASAGRADREGLREAFEKREAQFATGMPGGIAIPHCRAEAVTQPALGLIRLAEPVDFGSKDGPADLIIGIAAPEGTGDAHMKLLAKLSRSLVRKDFLATLRSAQTPEEAAAAIAAVVQPDEAPQAAGAGAAAPARAEDSAPAASDKPVLLAITSCPTGIAHTYMAAESLEEAAKEKGIELHVETQGSGGIVPFTPEVIAKAGAIIIAADVGITGRDRFAGMPVIESGVKRPMSEAGKMLDEAVAAANDPHAVRVAAGGGAKSDDGAAGGAKVGWGKRIQQAVMTGVSYMIPFVAAGGLLIALGFAIGGYDVSFVANDVALNYSLWNLPDAVPYSIGDVETMTSASGLALYLGALFSALGSWGMSFLVAALSGYVAFGLAGRPGIAPGFIGGALSVAIGAGFIGGLVTGILSGLLALWLSSLKPPRWLAGLMPVVIIPLVVTAVVGLLMLLLLGRPLASIMVGLQGWLTGMTGSSAILLGVILGLMMCFDLGGPVNKAAYLFATAGLSQGTEASWMIMAAVMASGMVPPLAMALSTALRPRLYTDAERENGTTAWLLGAAFISEGAIPFAAADPLRVIPSMMTGGAVTGALCMALGVTSKAPHGGLFVFFAIDPFWGFLVSVIAGTIVGALVVTVLKQMGAKKNTPAEVAA